MQLLMQLIELLCSEKMLSLTQIKKLLLIFLLAFLFNLK